MSKLLLVLCIAFLAVSVAIACNPPGFPCMSDDDCCPMFHCNIWARRCTKVKPVPPPVDEAP
ncbi:uncharacterized protein LOC127277179 [Leptopilina boulardi]|uniref:uncharacterized protein LOC127277179 n=1 Tax=Leptopilina boulardi TaxID=63433 RepID=UPI0021F5268C|nr:uncharacterized protein LOC127277179 [Leptopilina boulardi]XP_051154016.1 uncharacterized protein LOC127277179 [Leptopilina boulardi]